MSKDTSGPAFPCMLENDHMHTIDGFAGDKIESGTVAVYAGMSIRQYAAIKEMQGLSANSVALDNLAAYASMKGMEPTDSVANAAVSYADALLAELEK